MGLSKQQQGTILVVLSAAFVLRTKFAPAVSRQAAATKEELDAARQQLYHDKPDGSKDLLVPFRGGISKARLLPA